MRMTLLDYTQNILSSLSSDEVNSISDTTESMQVAEVVRTTYFNVIARAGITNHKQLVQLDPSLDPNMPVLMFVPDGVKKIDYIKYFNSSLTADTNTSTHGINVDITPNFNSSWTTTSTSNITIGTGTKVFTVGSSGLAITAGDTVTASYTSGTSNYMTGTVTSYTGTTLTINVTFTNGSGTFSNWSISGGNIMASAKGYQYVTILPIKQFIEMTNSFNPANDNVESFVFTNSQNSFPGTFTFYFKNNKQPQYCTVISNYYVIFDGYDNTLDSTLQTNKVMAEGEVIPSFLMEDDFIPDLSEDQVPLLLNEAKSLAFFELKQSTHPKAEQEAKRQWSAAQRDKSVVNSPSYFNALPNFGRIQTGNSNYFKSRGWDR